MQTIDGSMKSGSGTIVRYSLALASLLGEKTIIENIRASRKKPGLRPQHLKAVEACCRLTSGSAEHAEVKSTRIVYNPGKEIRGGAFEWDIGTAGSATMLAYALLPVALFARQESVHIVKGGLFQDFAPDAHHMKYVLLELLKKFSVRADLEIQKPGYVPSGQGSIKLSVKPAAAPLKPAVMLRQGNIREIKGIALSSHLAEKRVSMRMADSCRKILANNGYQADIKIVNDVKARQKGASLCVYALTDTGCILGSDMAGKLGRPAEFIGEKTAKNLIKDIRTGAAADRYAADQLILFAALADGESEFRIPMVTAHIESNLWLVEKLLGAKSSIRNNIMKIKGIGFRKY